MSYRYYPYSEHICYHKVRNGGCIFCGFHRMKNCVSPIPVPIEQQIQHFNNFVNNKKNYQDILKKGRLIVAPQGSWFIEVPKLVRQHIYHFVESHNLEFLSECRADVINKEKMRNILDTELKPYMFIYTGLEVANNSDLKLINKGCELDDYISFSRFIRSRGVKLGTNILIAPPLVQNPIRKALKTAKFAFENLQASEIIFFSCIPRLGSLGHNLWRRGKWNPISTTESSEIFQIIKAKYPDKKVRLDTMRVHWFHGKYAGPKIKTDAQKIAARKNVRKIAKEVFGS